MGQGRGLRTGRQSRSQRRQQNWTLQNGKLTNAALLPTRTAIQSGLNLMEAIGVTPQTSKVKVSANAMAQVFLSAVAVSPSPELKNYSLVAHQTDTEVIINPNIMDSNAFEILTPQVVETLDKFVSPSDSFYTLDEPLAIGIQEYNKKSRGKKSKIHRGGDFNKLAAAIIQGELRADIPPDKKSKYFNNEMIAEAKERMKY
jgi:hypothetical protein